MRQKFADFPNWKRVLQKKYINKYFDTPEFKGNISLLTAVKVKEKIVKIINGKEIVVFNDNFKWLELYPEDNKNLAVMVGINDKDEIFDCFIDIAQNTGITEAGVPYIDDLYLDITINLLGELKLVDEDELQEALDNNDITKEQYDLAYKVANKTIKKLDGKFEKLKEFSIKYFNLLKEENAIKDK